MYTREDLLKLIQNLKLLMKQAKEGKEFLTAFGIELSIREVDSLISRKEGSYTSFPEDDNLF